MEQRAVEKARELWKDEQGIGVVEVILILVVLIGLVIIFKSQLTSLVNTIFRKITSESSGI
ncbi:MAG: Flp1 family type IVb pilin [Hespellia sp.]|nr:Flp1 family type IVb pilin [Hespellia sp.]